MTKTAQWFEIDASAAERLRAVEIALKYALGTVQHGDVASRSANMFALGNLEEVGGRGLATISSETLAKLGGTTSAQVRKDLSFFGSFGKRGLGYPVPELVSRLREILGLGREWQVVIVGAGKIGSALAQYSGFGNRGFRVVAVYDNNAAKIGTQWDGHSVRDIKQLADDCATLHPDIAVLAVPGAAAQDTADVIVRAGIHGILNFAPVQLRVPSDVIVRAVNMAAELEVLSYALAHRGEFRTTA